MTSTLDAHEKPPEHVKNLYKKFQKAKGPNLDLDFALLDLNHADKFSDELTAVGVLSRSQIYEACISIEDSHEESETQDEFLSTITDCLVLEHTRLKGLRFVPSLLPARTQRTLLSSLLHRDLSNQQHLTNIHFHHTLPYPVHNSSFFSYLPSSDAACQPKDPSTHKPIQIQSLLQRKLRWMTLGGQYDWTAKRYPSEEPPDFPPDIARLLEILFPETKAQAAIVNLYTPGDTLSMHRDVSEASDKGLISISLGCDAIFVIGLGQNPETGSTEEPVVVRLRSGDAVLMSGSSRFAWHGVPQIIPNTCPLFLENWPADKADDNSSEYSAWKGWMKNKRINLNVRQMFR